MTEATNIFQTLDTLCFAGDKPVGRAIFKQEAADFCVDEELGFALSGDGEHLCVRLQKTEMNTAELARQLSRVFAVPLSAISYAGMKDRRAVSSQWFSIQRSGTESESDNALLASIENDSVKVLGSGRNSRKIKIGSHKANRFRIRLRQCSDSGEDQQTWDGALKRISQQGVPNYFGPQRFGWKQANLHQAQQLMEQGLNAKKEGKSVRRSGHGGRRGGKGSRNGMLFSASRSYLFNLQLSRRLEMGNWDKYLPGDVLSLDGSNRCFLPDSEQGWDDELQRRLDSFDIHITGLLPGIIESKERYISSGEAADIEEVACKEFPVFLKGLKHFGLKASRRPLRFWPRELKWSWQSGDNSACQDLNLEFTLPRGAYATSLLRELCQLDNHE